MTEQSIIRELGVLRHRAERLSKSNFVLFLFDMLIQELAERKR